MGALLLTVYWWSGSSETWSYSLTNGVLAMSTNDMTSIVHGHTSALPAVVILLRLLGVMERTQRICWMPHHMGACRRFDTRTSVLPMWIPVAIFDVFWSALGVAHF